MNNWFSILVRRSRTQRGRTANTRPMRSKQSVAFLQSWHFCSFHCANIGFLPYISAEHFSRCLNWNGQVIRLAWHRIEMTRLFVYSNVHRFIQKAFPEEEEEEKSANEKKCKKAEVAQVAPHSNAVWPSKCPMRKNDAGA